MKKLSMSDPLVICTTEALEAADVGSPCRRGKGKGNSSGSLDVTAAVAAECELQKVLGAMLLQAYELADPLRGSPDKFRRKQRVIMLRQAESARALVRQHGSAALSVTLAELELCLHA